MAKFKALTGSAMKGLNGATQWQHMVCCDVCLSLLHCIDFVLLYSSFDCHHLRVCNVS